MVVVVVVMMFVTGMRGVMLMLVIAVADHEFMRAGGKSIGSRPLEWIFRLEKCRIQLGRAAQVEPSDVQHAVERDLRIFGAMDLCDRVDPVDTSFQCIQLSRRN